MKNKILFLIILILITGCSKNDNKNNDNVSKKLSSELNYIVKEKINEETVRIYAVVKNTSENSGKIKSMKLMLVDKDTNELAYETTKKYNYEFGAGEEVLVTFDVPTSINDKQPYISVIPTYDAKVTHSSKKEFKQVIAAPAEKKIENATDKSKVTMGIYFVEDTKISKLKVTMHSDNDIPTCIAYIDINKTVKKDKKYTYEFECESGINIDGYTTFEI